MNQRQLYITMFLLMALWLILQKDAWISPNKERKAQDSEQILLRKGPSVQDAIRNKSGEKYALGLALSGGGIKCLCHVGVLKAMEEEGLKPDVISGVSAGAVVAAMYADGYSPDSIFSIFKNIKYSDLFRLEMPDGGLFTLTGFKEFLDTILRAKTFEELKIPLRVVVTDIDAGKSVVFDRGPLVDALVATCSVPVLFSPYNIDGVNYVDGGVLQNLPASVIRTECKYLIGVSLGPLKADPYEKSIANVALRSYKFIFRSNANYDKGLCDMVIEPSAISKYNGGDVNRAHEIFNIGYQEAKKMLQLDKKR
ncbi:MAG: patatin-like phospholipase family protein [Bacteroidales bacterium]|nr:patatin-like phospholipase family protein [Bacteroidales bacterium]MDD3907539.1 patatin-like phospholipase family protein [Bacteroidales bacterium]MDD4712841.1 patatin-like phospholipase family protein [Bacteroidales bacterium]